MKGCLLFPFRLLMLGLSSAVTGVVLFILIGGAAFGAYKWFTSDRVEEPSVEVGEVAVVERPSVKDAPFIVQTSSRYYLVTEYEETDDAITLRGYWEERGQKGWVWSPEITLNRWGYGTWIVIARAFD